MCFSLLSQGVQRLVGAEEATHLEWVLGLIAGISSILLLAGFLTPIVSALAILWSVKLAWVFLSEGAYANLTSAVVPGLVALAIVFLGPGAFSVDCRLFGRRQIIIPQAYSSTHGGERTH